MARNQSGERAARARRRIQARRHDPHLRALLHHFQITADKRRRTDEACAAHRHIIAAVAFLFQPRGVFKPQLVATFLRLRFRFARQAGNDVHLCAKNAVKQHICANIVFIRLHISVQVENRLHADTAAGRHGLHGVVGLRRAVGKHGVASLFLRVAQQIFELADFVAAKKAHAGKIVALDVEIHAELFAQSVEPNQRGREKTEVRARLLVKQRMQLFKSVHG